MQLTSDTKFVLGILVATIIVIAGGAYITSKKSASPSQIVPDSLISRLTTKEAPNKGPSDAKVTFVEFADFQCPVCKSVHPIIKALEEKYKDSSVRFVFRNFPLSQHEHAQLASEAAMTASLQGKFWEYRDMLFENQTKLEKSDLESYAASIGLDIDAFKKSLEDQQQRGVVHQDIADGNALGVQGTPTIFINNMKYGGKYSIDDFSAIIDEQLTK